jgi:hypothetical protein
MEQSLSWEADCHSADQEIFCHFMKPEDSLAFSQEPVTKAYPEPV